MCFSPGFLLVQAHRRDFCLRCHEQRNSAYVNCEHYGLCFFKQLNIFDGLFVFLFLVWSAFSFVFKKEKNFQKKIILGNFELAGEKGMPW